MASQNQYMNIIQDDSTNTLMSAQDVSNTPTKVVEVVALQVIEAPPTQIIEVTQVQVEDSFKIVSKPVRKTKVKLVTPKSEKPIEEKKIAKTRKNVETAVKVIKHKANHPDFPELGYNISRAQEKEITINNMNLNIPNVTPPHSIDPRTRAFETISDKDKLARVLVRTKACRIVTDGGNEDEAFGVCYREYCTFAHSMEELNAPPCQFDENCRFKNGRLDQDTGKITPESECKFRHSSETITEWMKRARITPPNIPLTNEKSRQPKTSTVTDKPVPKTEKIHQTNTSTVTDKPVPKSMPSKHASITKQKTSKWDEKPGAISPTQPVLVKKHVKKEVVYQSDSYSSSSDYDSSSSSSSDSSDGHRHSRRKHRLPVKRSSKKNFDNSNLQIIKVPTSELAEMAIKAAFDRGVYNIQVIVE